MTFKNQYPKYLTPAIHVLFWMLLFFIPYILRLTSTGSRMSDNMQYRLLLNNCTLIAFFYLNAYFLFPAVYKKRGILVYIISLALAVFLFTKFTSIIEHEYLPSHRKWKGGFFYPSLLPYIFIIGISISYRVVADYSRQEKSRKEKENETLKTELSFLRSQVSPHFMFNVLNTFVSLARKKSDLMEPSLIQLSNLMRYMLYESNDERIGLEQEIRYLKSYIDLQLLRFGDDLNIELHIGDDLETYEIEPMLLISFVENAFKHGVGMVDEPFIHIFLSVNKENHWLEFKVENTVSSEGTKDKSSGIGLSNMGRRLELLYKGHYKLETSEKDGIFTSTLVICLR